VLVVLALTGFVSSRADEQVTQPDSAITGVLAAFTAVPAVLIIVSIPFIRRYGIESAKPVVPVTPGGSHP
jgi:Na+/melibiose symporter-like transporter